ncbi:MAG: hypothetical protein EOO75_00365 [Myxococcales bacterium]|nr:MAG: hypothetical protein EOO75_00365 [Myxococcales bacterium]
MALFGLITLGSSAYFAAWPAPARVAFLRWMMVATGFATVQGMVWGMATVFHGLGSIPGEVPVKILFVGLGESLSLGILGFALLALGALLTAVGHRRLADQGA